MRNFSKIQAGILLAMMAVSMAPMTSVAQTAVTTSATSTSAAFSDVTSAHVNADAISYLKAKGVIQGYPSGAYLPSLEINRAEFTKIIVASLVPNPKGANCFGDVKDQWYAPYICEAKARGIIGGYADGSFKPSAKINFSEASKIITNAYGVKAVGTAPSKDRWFKPYVSALEAKKDIPLSVDFFDENVKRDAMAEMVYRLKANVTTKPTRTYDEVVGDNFVTLNSCAELKQRFDEQNAYDNIENYGHGYGRGEIFMEQAPTMAAPASADDASAKSTAAPAPTGAMSSEKGGGGTSEGAATDFSTTNLQVAGVDEADVIKNDGKFIYIIKGSELRIVEAYPADNLKELVNLTLGDKGETFTPTEMYVDGNQLTVVGSDYKDQPSIQLSTKLQGDFYMPSYNFNRTKVFVVDITDRTKPVVKRAVEFDGSYTTSRKVGGTLYLVMNYGYSPVIYYDYLPPMEGAAPTPYSSVSAVDAEAVVPKMLDTHKGKEELVAPCSQIRILPKEHNSNYMIAAAVPLNDLNKDVSRSVVAGSSGTVYASQNNLYVSGNDWGGGFYRPYGDYGTSIYRFALGNGTIDYKAKGRVPGQLLNQFSMDESNGYFRAVTTKNAYVPGSEINNNVYVLNMDMAMTGKIENIAPGEKLYSARFMGNKAYLVTFKRVDPFFVLDLSSPSNPRIAGKLKIPGFSDYLEPYDDNHIIGFGSDVDESKVTEGGDFLTYDAKKGFKISLFDVTDINNPKEMFKEIIGEHGTTSEVTTNHKALLFDRAKNLLALPITVYGYPAATSCSKYTYSSCPASCDQVCKPSSCVTTGGVKVCTPDCEGANSCVQPVSDYSKPVFDGAYVYNLNLTDGFKLKGKITHYDAVATAALATNGYNDYEKTIQRLMYIGEYLYSVSPSAVKANVLSTLVEKKMIELSGVAYPIYWGKPMPL